MMAAAGRDPRRWDRPDRFDVHRRAKGHVSVGTGIHHCVGQGLARVEARSGLGREAFVDEGAVERLSGQGLLVRNGDRLAVTDDGILLLDSILSEAVRTS